MIFTRDALKKAIDDGILEVGEFTYGEPVIRTAWYDAKVYIGKYCSIADGVEIFAGGNHRVDWISTYPFPACPNEFPAGLAKIKEHPVSKGPVRIGNDVWLGSRCTIMSGVTIGDGAVIGAHAVVTKDVPPYTITAGNPARVVRERFPKEVAQRLIDLAWWDWPPEKVDEFVPTLLSSDYKFLLNSNKKSFLQRLKSVFL